MSRKLDFPRFDPTDAISVLTSNRKERFPVEREMALIGFSVWMCFPKDSRLVSAAQVIGAANHFVHVTANRRVSLARSNPYFAQSAFASILLDYPMTADFKAMLEFEFNDLQNIAEIVNFFMCCPDEHKPSLLKAIYFIDEKGFVPSDVPSDEKDQYKRSISTLKNSWRKLAVAAPFIWAASIDEFKLIRNLSPSGSRTPKFTSKVLSKRAELLEFFGLAKFCQERLVSHLTPRTFNFIKFPRNIDPVAVDCEKLD